LIELLDGFWIWFGNLPTREGMLSMAVRAQNATFLGFFLGGFPSPRLVQGEKMTNGSLLLHGIEMIKIKCGGAFVVSAFLATAAMHFQQGFLAFHALQSNDSMIFVFGADALSLAVFFASSATAAGVVGFLIPKMAVVANIGRCFAILKLV
jgi:hypothetical protein